MSSWLRALQGAGDLISTRRSFHVLVAYGIKRGFGLWNIRIAPKEGDLISTEYDAIHILLVGGDVFIHDNVVPNLGGVGINLNGPVYSFAKIDADGKNLVLTDFFAVHFALRSSRRVR